MEQVTHDHSEQLDNDDKKNELELSTGDYSEQLDDEQYKLEDMLNTAQNKIEENEGNFGAQTLLTFDGYRIDNVGDCQNVDKYMYVLVKKVFERSNGAMESEALYVEVCKVQTIYIHTIYELELTTLCKNSISKGCFFPAAWVTDSPGDANVVTVGTAGMYNWEEHNYLLHRSLPTLLDNIIHEIYFLNCNYYWCTQHNKITGEKGCGNKSCECELMWAIKPIMQAGMIYVKNVLSEFIANNEKAYIELTANARQRALLVEVSSLCNRIIAGLKKFAKSNNPTDNTGIIMQQSVNISYESKCEDDDSDNYSDEIIYDDIIYDVTKLGATFTIPRDVAVLTVIVCELKKAQQESATLAKQHETLKLNNKSLYDILNESKHKFMPVRTAITISTLKEDCSTSKSSQGWVNTPSLLTEIEKAYQARSTYNTITMAKIREKFKELLDQNCLKNKPSKNKRWITKSMSKSINNTNATDDNESTSAKTNCILCRTNQCNTKVLDGTVSDDKEHDNKEHDNKENEFYTIYDCLTQWLDDNVCIEVKNTAVYASITETPLSESTSNMLKWLGKQGWNVSAPLGISAGKLETTASEVKEGKTRQMLQNLKRERHTKLEDSDDTAAFIRHTMDTSKGMCQAHKKTSNKKVLGWRMLRALTTHVENKIAREQFDKINFEGEYNCWTQLYDNLHANSTKQVNVAIYKCNWPQLINKQDLIERGLEIVEAEVMGIKTHMICQKTKDGVEYRQLVVSPGNYGEYETMVHLTALIDAQAMIQVKTKELDDTFSCAWFLIG